MAPLPPTLDPQLTVGKFDMSTMMKSTQIYRIERNFFFLHLNFKFETRKRLEQKSSAGSHNYAVINILYGGACYGAMTSIFLEN